MKIKGVARAKKLAKKRAAMPMHGGSFRRTLHEVQQKHVLNLQKQQKQEKENSHGEV